MKTKQITTVACALLLGMLSGCGNGSEKGKNAENAKQSAQNLTPYIANTNTENPSVYLSLIESKETDSSFVYTAKSLRDKDTIGLQIEVVKNLQPGLDDNGAQDAEKGFTPGGIKFSSIGEESNKFVNALGGLYKHNAQTTMTDSTLLPLVFSSNKQPVDLTKNGTYNFKLFLANKVGAEAEAFVTLDLYKHLFELRAKDSTQYERIISAFEGK